jgi:flagellar hook-associated protein 1 FlgK
MALGFSSLEIAKSGMAFSETALAVTGHNVSNVNTNGYVRQQAMSAASRYHKASEYQYGLGAEVQDIRQIRNQFLDNVYRNENTTLGYWETKSETFQNIQAILGDPMNSGLQDVMNQFWDSWQELSKEPDSLTVRALVVKRGEALVDQINHIGSQIDKLQQDLNSEFGVRIAELNDITSKIANLNLIILNNELTGDSANDYRDQRNSLVDRLSKLADVDVTEMQDGQLDITLGGYFLVSKGVHNNIVAEGNGESGLFYVPKLEGTEIVVPIKSGILKGILESRGNSFGTVISTDDYSNILPGLKKKLNDLVYTLATKLNTIHAGGKTLNDPPSTGAAFFVPINSAYDLQMGNIKLNDNLTNLSNVVASRSGASGDNTVALEIANLRGLKCITDSKGLLSIDDFYQSIILEVGNGGYEAEAITKSQQALVNSADNQRQAIMGVSMDEEMSNMMKYKFSYSAASRAINVIDDMLETIITRMGLVGR